MSSPKRFLTGFAVAALLSACNGGTAQSPAAGPHHYNEVDWTDLMPASDLEALLNPPAYVLDVSEGSMEDKPAGLLKSNITEPADSYQRALTSTRVRPELDGNKIRIASYLVPIEYNDKQQATTFFAVPFFGACIHVPPPPPNQIILVHSERGVHIQDMQMPFWLSGELHTGIEENELATAAYSMTLASHEPYAEP